MALAGFLAGYNGLTRRSYAPPPARGSVGVLTRSATSPATLSAGASERSAERTGRREAGIPGALAAASTAVTVPNGRSAGSACHVGGAASLAYRAPAERDSEANRWADEVAMALIVGRAP